MVNDFLDLDLRQGVVFKIFFEITVTIIKDKVQLFISGYYFFKVNDIRVFKDFEKGYLPDSGGGKPFILMVKTYFFESNDLVCLLVPGFVNDSVSALTDFVYTLKLVILWMTDALLM